MMKENMPSFNMNENYSMDLQNLKYNHLPFEKN
jgi:hypothetical protein